MVKNLPANAGDTGFIPGCGRSPEEGIGNPLPVFFPGKSHGQSNLEGYSPWDCKESDMIEQLNSSAPWGWTCLSLFHKCENEISVK